jgi:hypothetical protein
MAGITRPTASNVPLPLLFSTRARSELFAAAVETVSVDVPTLFDVDIAPRAQVAVALGETLQVSVTLEGLSPPDAVIVTVDSADFPAAIVEGESAVADRLNAGEATASNICGEKLALKLTSPL